MKCTRCRGQGRGPAARAQRRLLPAVLPLLLPPPGRARDRRASTCSRREERVLVAVSGGKDSLALWDVLVELGYDTTGLYLGLGIGAYSDALAREGRGVRRSARPAAARRRRSRDEGPGLAVPDVAALDAPVAVLGVRHDEAPLLRRGRARRAASTCSPPATTSTTRRRACSATCCAGSAITSRASGRSSQPTHPKFVRKVKPLYLLSEYETRGLRLHARHRLRRRGVPERRRRDAARLQGRAQPARGREPGHASTPS